MYTVCYEYWLGDRVTIKDLKLVGHVISISNTQVGTQYEVRFFTNGEHKFSYLFDYEIERCSDGQSHESKPDGVPRK